MARVVHEVRQELVRLGTEALVYVENEGNDKFKDGGVGLEIVLLEGTYYFVTELV